MNTEIANRSKKKVLRAGNVAHLVEWLPTMHKIPKDFDSPAPHTVRYSDTSL